MSKRGNAHEKITAVMEYGVSYTSAELSQLTGISQEGIQACIRGMSSRREIVTLRGEVGRPFQYRLPVHWKELKPNQPLHEDAAK